MENNLRVLEINISQLINVLAIDNNYHSRETLSIARVYHWKLMEIIREGNTNQEVIREIEEFLEESIIEYYLTGSVNIRHSLIEETSSNHTLVNG